MNKMEDMIKIVKLLEELGLLIKGINETIKNEAQKQKGRFLSMILGTLAAIMSACVFTLIHREGCICLDQLEYQRKDQQY